MDALLQNKYGLLAGCIMFSALIIAVDHATGPVIRFPIVFVFPVAICSWFVGLAWAVFLAFCLPFVRFLAEIHLARSWSLLDAALNSGIQVVTLFCFAILVRVAARQHKEIRVLRGLLPICSFCKKIRVEAQWVQVEKYVTEHSEAEFSHGLCPECLHREYGEFLTPKS